MTALCQPGVRSYRGTSRCPRPVALQESARPAGAGRRLLSLVGWAGPARVGAVAPGALLGPKLPGLPGRVADQNRTPRTGSPEDRAEQKPNTLYPGMQMTPPKKREARSHSPGLAAAAPVSAGVGNPCSGRLVVASSRGGGSGGLPVSEPAVEPRPRAAPCPPQPCGPLSTTQPRKSGSPTVVTFSTSQFGVPTWTGRTAEGETSRATRAHADAAGI